MPFYRVWYREIDTPLAFSTTSRFTEAEIVDRILANEHIDVAAGPGVAPTVTQRIAQHGLAPVRYTEDESEINRIG